MKFFNCLTLLSFALLAALAAGCSEDEPAAIDQQVTGGALQEQLEPPPANREREQTGQSTAAESARTAASVNGDAQDDVAVQTKSERQGEAISSDENEENPSADRSLIVDGDKYSLHRIENCDELLEVHRYGTLSNSAYYLEPDPSDDGWDPPSYTDPHQLIRQTWQRLSARLSGVEESNLVKFDGKYIYSMTTHSFVVSKPDAESGVDLIGQLKLRYPERHARGQLPVRSELILYQGTALAIRSWSDFFANDGWHGDSVVQIFEIDVKNPNQPTIVRELELQNTELLASWLVEDQFRMAFWHFAPATSLRGAWQMRGEPDAEDAARRHNEALVGDLDITHWQPRYQLRNAEGEETLSGATVACEDTYAPAREYWQPYATFMMSFEASMGIDMWRSSAVLTDYYRIHATRQHIYLHRSDLYPERNAQIYQFGYGDDLTMRFYAQNFFHGHFPRNAALEEYEGVLRVAYSGWDPTLDQWGGRLVMLRPSKGPQGGEDAAQMEEIGSIVISEEEIRFLRFAGPVAYVTPWVRGSGTRATARLYVLDLSRPTMPSLVGTEANRHMSVVPEFRGDCITCAEERRDLIRIDQGTVVVVGRHVGSDGYAENVSVALIDASDPLMLDVVSEFVAQGSFSPYQYDERAALVADGRLWLPSGGLCYEGSSTDFYGLRLSSRRLQHEHTFTVSGCAAGPPGVRALFVDGRLHLISGFEIRSFDPDTGTEVGLLSLAP